MSVSALTSAAQWIKPPKKSHNSEKIPPNPTKRFNVEKLIQ
jgi:hypothetical protein